MRLIPFTLAALGLAVPAGAATTFSVINLVTNDQAAHPAQITDASLKNAWGISYPATGPFWVSDNGTGVSTLYQVNPSTNVTTKVALTVSIPGDGSVTGQVNNPGSGAGQFNGDNFLFANEDGTVSGWRGALGTTAETLASGLPTNVYKGLATAIVSGNSYLYAANFRTGSIDVLKGLPAAPDLAGNFTDPGLPSGYAPFNVQVLGGKVYVTYALQDASQHDEQSGAGRGFVSVFDTQGNFLGRVASQGTLDAPWGLAIAPASFAEFAGDLLVGNFGDGRINAYNLGTNTFVGQLQDANSQPLALDGLWGLIAGNGGSAGSTQKIYFSAGPDDEANGLFGVIVPSTIPLPSSLSLGLTLGGAGLLVHLRRRHA